jgi:hypothetical protein
MGDMRNVYKILVGKPQRKRQLGRAGWKNIIKIVLREIRCEGVI